MSLTVRSAVSSEEREERSQAIARFGVCAVVILFLLALWGIEGTLYRLHLAVVSVYGLGSLGWLLLVRRFPGRFPARRLAAILGDLSITSYFTHSLGSWGAFFYPLYLWIVVGNGVRFGPKYLLAAMSVSLPLFGAVVFSSPHWRSVPTLGMALLVGLFVLPIFFRSVIVRLHQAKGDLEQALTVARSASRAKDEFLANMSHELRTPLSGILGVAQLMESTPLSPLQKRYLGLITRSGRTLRSIVDDILDFSRIHAGKLPLDKRPVDLKEILEDLCSLAGSTAEAKGLTLTRRIEPRAVRYVMADATRMQQILSNLIGNAIKFTDRGKVEIVYRSEPLAAEGHLGTIQVSDTGIGIPEERLELIFRQFEQVDPQRSRRHGGSGLGLAISRRLAEMMGGEIAVRSAVGEGTVFTVRLPLEEAPPPLESEGGPDLPSRSFQLRTLVAEDNEVNQVVIRGMLKLLGIEADLATTGAEAHRLHTANGYDLIFMDVQMPGMDGLEATRHIRSDEEGGAHVTIIGLTANASKKDRSICLEAGMDDHIGKPLSLDDLTDRLDVLVAGQRLGSGPPVAS